MDIPVIGGAADYDKLQFKDNTPFTFVTLSKGVNRGGKANDYILCYLLVEHMQRVESMRQLAEVRDD